MGIYDRDYYRDDEPRGFQLGLSQSVVINLVIVNIAIYLVDVLFQIGLADRLALQPDLFSGSWGVWQLVTYGFAHAPDPWHVLGNMFILWMFGTDVEGVYGRKLFFRLYLSLVICSGLTYLVFTRLTEEPVFWRPMVGASGAIMGMLILFVCHFPYRTIRLNLFIPVPAWIVGVLWLARDIFGAINGGDNVAYSAHLGGAAFGYLFYKTHWHLLGLLPEKLSAPRLRRQPPLRVHRPVERDDDLSAQADAILEKISVSGQDSLTAQERRVLEEYSRRMQQKRK